MPSALDYLGHFKDALEIERRLLKPGVSRALKDVLNSLVATYNKMATSKRHRVDASRKAVTYNMLPPVSIMRLNFLLLFSTLLLRSLFLTAVVTRCVGLILQGPEKRPRKNPWCFIPCPKK